MAIENDLVRICSVGELPAEGAVHEFPAGKKMLCIAKLNGVISALDNECSHHGGPLGQGMIENGKVICPWHAYAFDLTTGLCDDDADERVRVFEVTVSGDDVLVKL
ncbi:Rieske 2Fe-2S family protein [Acidisarcina polymorpha]|uniref:Rieske 2Fe-2S family protein n=1 Tax=Acidisarcina polymorpha TaxID=2211140 RepID=A0A2Z5FRU6_9BACT|nr:Rieske (2Fe-2S) protein [Acidisarcina polymorpha]AXC09409.1 Rieske 2Fe-2S family protein [Acidisarcina polymorpha]